VTGMITLPTNRDENWRYANLRPLTRAKPEPVDPAASAPTALPKPSEPTDKPAGQ